jgi:hypothetical protein
MHDLDCLLLILDGADMPATEAENRNLDAGLAKRPLWEAFGVVVGAEGIATEDAKGGSRGDTGLDEFAASIVGIAGVRGESPCFGKRWRDCPGVPAYRAP